MKKSDKKKKVGDNVKSEWVMNRWKKTKDFVGQSTFCILLHFYWYINCSKIIVFYNNPAYSVSDWLLFDDL